MFALLVFATAFLIETIGTFVSVIGLSSLFSSNPIIIALAIALDIGKVVTVSFLYKKWKQINFVMKGYMLVAATVLMLITSAGAAGFLTGEFQKAIAGNQTNSVMIASLQDEQAKLASRKKEIDAQVASLPANNVRGRVKLMAEFKDEVQRINTRIVEIDEELPKLKVETITKNNEVGPIITIAATFDITPEQAVKWVVLLIIGVFDPLAIALILAGNFLIDEKNRSVPIVQTSEAIVEPEHILEPEPVAFESEPAPQYVVLTVDKEGKLPASIPEEPPSITEIEPESPPVRKERKPRKPRAKKPVVVTEEEQVTLPKIVAAPLDDNSREVITLEQVLTGATMLDHVDASKAEELVIDPNDPTSPSGTVAAYYNQK